MRDYIGRGVATRRAGSIPAALRGEVSQSLVPLTEQNHSANAEGTTVHQKRDQSARVRLPALQAPRRQSIRHGGCGRDPSTVSSSVVAETDMNTSPGECRRNYSALGRPGCRFESGHDRHYGHVAQPDRAGPFRPQLSPGLTGKEKPGECRWNYIQTVGRRFESGHGLHHSRVAQW